VTVTVVDYAGYRITFGPAVFKILASRRVVDRMEGYPDCFRHEFASHEGRVWYSDDQSVAAYARREAAQRFAGWHIDVISIAWVHNWIRA
jgi:hypothetical protein